MIQDVRARYALPLALDLAALGLAVALHDGLEAYQATARFTGRVSLALFAVLSLLYAWPSRRHEGRSLMGPFAAVHLFHFACLAAYLHQLGEWPAPARLAGGGLAYALIVAVPFAQRFAQGLSGRARRAMESVYLGWVGFIFLMSYVLRIAGKVPGAGGSRTEHLLLLGVALAALIAHLALRMRARYDAPR